MSESEVTLLAALIAAIASMISLLGNIFSTWQGELRATHRTALSPFLAELGSTIDMLFAACAKYSEQTDAGDLNPASLQEATQAANKLSEVRAKVKYPLWGVDSGLETLIQLPGWLKDWANDPKSQKRLLAEASNLRHLLDDTIRRSYHNGRPPTIWQTWLVRSSTARLEQGWGHSNSSATSHR